MPRRTSVITQETPSMFDTPAPAKQVPAPKPSNKEKLNELKAAHKAQQTLLRDAEKATKAAEKAAEKSAKDADKAVVAAQKAAEKVAKEAVKATGAAKKVQAKAAEQLLKLQTQLDKLTQ